MKLVRTGVGRPGLGVDADGDGAVLGQVVGHLVLVAVGGGVGPARDLGHHLALLEGARATDGRVGVVGQRIEARRIDDVLYVPTRNRVSCASRVCVCLCVKRTS
jgi:hypothetical protein